MKLKTEIENIYQSIDSLKIIRESARDFALQYIKPYVLDWDENQHFPKEVLIKAGEFGFMGMIVPEEYGGSGLGYHEYVAVIEEISKVDPSIGLSLAAHNSLCTNHLLKFGNENQIKKYCHKNKCKLMGSGISYNSGTNKSFMNIRELKNLVEEK